MSEENIYIDGITSTLQAGSGLLAGGGMLWAAAVFGLWKAPEIGGWIKDKLGDTFSDLVDPGGILDDLADSLLDGSPITLRREAQDLARRRGELASQEASYCTISASSYDAALCSNVFLMKDQYYADLVLFRQKVRDHNAAHGESSDFIYQGLGDIDPDQDSNPTTTRSGVTSLNPSSSVGVPVSYVNLGTRGFTLYSEEQMNRAFGRRWNSTSKYGQTYSLEVGSHFQNARQTTDRDRTGGTIVSFDVEWDGSQWIYAIEGSYATWMANHYAMLAAQEQGEGFVPPYRWDHDTGGWVDSQTGEPIE